MAFLTEPVAIPAQHAPEFLNLLFHPDSGRMHDSDDIRIQRSGRDMEVDIEGLDLSFVKDERKEQI